MVPDEMHGVKMSECRKEGAMKYVRMHDRKEQPMPLLLPGEGITGRWALDAVVYCSRPLFSTSSWYSRARPRFHHWIPPACATTILLALNNHPFAITTFSAPKQLGSCT
jgi:hypothetical protein